MPNDFGASKRGGASDPRDRADEWSIAGAAGEYDSLADLFLGDEESSPLSMSTRAKPQAEAVKHHPKSTSLDSGPSGRDALSSHAASIEALVLGHLPVRAGPWVAQYARVIAQQRSTPIALVRAVADEISVELVGATKSRMTIDGAPFQSLETALSRVADVANHWIVQVDELNEPALTQDPRVTGITLLAGANEAAIVAAYRTIKSLATALDRQSSDRSHTSIQISIMGAKEDEAEAAIAKLRQAASTYLNMPVERAAPVPRMEPCPSLALFRGPLRVSHDELLAEIEFVAAGDEAAPPIPFVSAREPDRSAGIALELESIEFSEEELSGLASADSISSPEPAAQPSHAWPELVTQVAELKPFSARCPDDASVELAIDGEGRLHLLRMDHDGRAVDSLVSVTAWARKHRRLLTMAAPKGSLDPAASPVQHLFTTKPKDVRHLLDADAKVHLLAPVTIAGQRGWYCTELN